SGAGADATFDYRKNWPSAIKRLAGEHCIDVVLDGQAGPYVQAHLDLLAPDGRLVCIASHQNPTAEVNVREIVRRRLTLTGSTLRPRTPEYKGKIAAALVQHVWPLLVDGQMRTRIHAVFPIERIRDAHSLLDSNRQIGKVVLVMNPERAAEYAS